MSWSEKLYSTHLSTRYCGRECIYLEETDSTNRWMQKNSHQFSLTGGVVVAGHQTAGRGRDARNWFDLPGQSLLFTICLRQRRNCESLGLLGFLPAVALGDYLQSRFGDRHGVQLKWPNDVLLNGKKTAGVLGQWENCRTGQQLLLGMGVNIRGRATDWPKDICDRASSIEAETGITIPREVLLAELMNRMEPTLDELRTGATDRIRERWLALGPAVGSPVTRAEGGQSVAGSFIGVGIHGELLLRDTMSGAIHRFLTGDISSE